MDGRKKVDVLLQKIPTFQKSADFKAAYKDYEKRVKESPLNEGLDLRSQTVQSLLVVDKKPTEPLYDQYVIVAEVGKPLQLLGYDAEGNIINFKADEARAILRTLDTQAKAEKASKENATDRIARLTALIEKNEREIKKAGDELKQLIKEGTGKAHDKDKLRSKINELTDKNAKYRNEKNQIEIVQSLDSIANQERIRKIKESPLLKDIRAQLSPIVPLEEKVAIKTTERVAGSIQAITSDWGQLEAEAQASGISMVELLTEHFSKMTAHERQAAQEKLTVFEKAVDTLPGATPRMKQIPRDILKALAISQLTPEEKIIYQQAIIFGQAMKENNMQKAVLAADRLGQFLSESKIQSFQEMKALKSLLAKEMPNLSGEFARLQYKEIQDRSFRERMSLAANAFSALSKKSTKTMFQSGKSTLDATDFITRNIIPAAIKDERNKIENLINDMEVEGLKFSNDAARYRALGLVKILRQHALDYEASDMSYGKYKKFEKNCKESISQAQQDITKHATPGWRGVLEAFSYYLSRLTAKKSQENVDGMKQNPHTFYAVQKGMTRVVEQFKDLDRLNLPKKTR